MRSIDFIKEHLNSKWMNSEGYEFTLVIDRIIKPKELYALEKELKITFPKDYIQFVSEIGLCRLVGRWEGKGEPQTFYSMLEPNKILEVMDAYKVWTDEHTYFDEEDEDEQKNQKNQQSIRNVLIPFQYYGDETSWDFYSFVPTKVNDSRCQVIVAYHDDDELDCWFDNDNSDKIWGFEEHISDWITSTKNNV